MTKRADKITKTAGHPACPYCNHPNNVFQFNAHREGVKIETSCDGCGAEYQWERFVVELYISEPVPERGEPVLYPMPSIPAIAAALSVDTAAVEAAMKMAAYELQALKGNEEEIK